jgi:hypothetical protein
LDSKWNKKKKRKNIKIKMSIVFENKYQDKKK